MGKGSHGAARRAQKARNSAKKNNDTKLSSVDSADHLAQSNKVAEEGNPEPPKSPKDSPEAPFTQDVSERNEEDQERNTTDLTSSTDTHSTSPDKIPEPEVIASRSPDPSEQTPNSNDGEVISLREQVRALEGELQELQQTLAESHQAFAEQIVQMSATKDQEKDTEIAQLQQNWERSQSDLQVQTERVHALEKQLEDRDKELETKSSTEAEHSAAMADMQAKMSDLVSKARTPTTESLAKVANDLGYTKESDYLHAAHNAKYTALHARFRRTHQEMEENMNKTMNAIEEALEPVDSAIKDAVMSPLWSLRTGWEASLSGGDIVLGRVDACS